MEPPAKEDLLPEIEPLQPRWEPKSNPRDIVVPGLDTTASVQDQIEQIEQLITIKLQVRDIIRKVDTGNG
jgi:DASH complex subunit ASK1